MDSELEQIEQFYNTVIEYITNYSFQILGAVLIFIIGVIASKYIHKYVLQLLAKTKLDETIALFTANFVKFLIIFMMAILALGKLGISIAPFIAALGAISLTAGLALQGSVSNFAAGIVLIITKPFKLGDTIRIHGLYGMVQEIKLAYTVLINEDKEQITVPNKYMIGDVLVNSFQNRIVEGSIGIAYDSDAQKAIDLIKKLLQENQKTSNENEAIVGIEKFADSSVLIAYRYWVDSSEFFKIQYEVNLEILKGLQKADINIPFPQREIRVLNEQERLN